MNFIRINLVIYPKSKKMQVHLGISVFACSRISLLKQFIDHPMKFVFKGIILSLKKQFDYYNISNNATIVAVEKSRYLKTDTKIQSPYSEMLHDAEEYAEFKQKLADQERYNKLRLNDLKDCQKLRRNSRIMRKIKYLLKKPHNLKESLDSLNSNINEYIYEPALKPSTDPLPVLW